MRFLFLLLFIANTSFAATFSYSGDFRSEWAFFNNIDLSSSRKGSVADDYLATGDTNNSGSSKQYLLSRFRLRPDFIVYDDVRVKSEWYFLGGTPLSASAMNNLGNANSVGWIAGGDNSTAEIGISRVWLEWSSDWGVLTVGRQPFHFGLGMLYDDGSDVWDYYETTVDRVAYNLILGNMNIKLGFDFLTEGAVNYALDNTGGLLIELGYDRPYEDMTMGFLYYMTYNNGLNSYTYDVFQKKAFPSLDLSFAWEFAYQSGKTLDYNGDGTNDKLQAFGFTLESYWSPSKFEMGFKTGMASGYKADAGNEYYGFNFNRNYKIAMLIFNEDIYIGADTVHGSQGIGSDFTNQGAFFFAPEFSYLFMDSKLKVATSLIYARVHRNNLNASKELGIEWDINVNYEWKKDLNTFFKFASLFPGPYFRTRTTAVGLMFGLGLSF